ncbi:unnamed protein product [Euphydryas editha]|uniref:Uncharacterized protein n=1 Tax=Euphydryas editha TaxID=104508 RepID=A0AAU9UHX2_EUPED|nr:unnamed protein product [Euphydryas editha]
MSLFSDSSTHLTTTTNPETDLVVFSDLLANIKRDRNDNINKHRSHSESLFYKNNDPFSFDILNEIDNYYVTEANNLKRPTNGTTNVTKNC